MSEDRIAKIHEAFAQYDADGSGLLNEIGYTRGALRHAVSRIAALEKRLGECEGALDTDQKCIARNLELERELRLTQSALHLLNAEIPKWRDLAASSRKDEEEVEADKYEFVVGTLQRLVRETRALISGKESS